MSLAEGDDGPGLSRSLLRHSEFLKLWSGLTVSLLGSQVTLLALPWLAAVELGASAVEMGILTAVGSLPVLVVGPLAGVWADRLRRRPLLIGADIGRAVLLGSVPLVALTTGLGVEFLWAVAFGIGALNVLFEVASASLLPSILARERLAEGNSRFEVSRSGALIVGPGLAGLAIQALTAAVALLVDALSFLVSALLIGRIRAPETVPVAAERRGVLAEAREGLRVVVREPILAAMATSLCLFNLFSGVFGAVYLLFVTRELGLSAGELGLVFAVGSAGFPIGAVVAPWVARRLGVGPAIVWGAAVSDAAFLLAPLASGPPAVALALLIGSRLVATLAGPVTAINQISLRQAMTPPRLLGRVNGAMMTIALGAAPLGGLLGGLLGEAVGLRPALLIGALGVQVGFVRLFFSPLRVLAEAPSPVVEDGGRR